MARYDQKNRIDLAPVPVQLAVQKELDKPDGERLSIKAIAYKFGFAHATVGRYKLKREREKIKNWRLSAITKIELRSLRIVTAFPDGKLVISTTYGKNSNCVNNPGKIQHINECDLHARDIRVTLRFVKGIIGNPDALRQSPSTKVPESLVPALATDAP